MMPYKQKLGVSYLSKKRLYELAKELGLSSKELIKKAKELNINVSTHMSSIESEEEKAIKELLLVKENNKDINIKQKELAEKTISKVKSIEINDEQKDSTIDNFETIAQGDNIKRTKKVSHNKAKEKNVKRKQPYNRKNNLKNLQP